MHWNKRDSFIPKPTYSNEKWFVWISNFLLGMFISFLFGPMNSLFFPDHVMMDIIIHNWIRSIYIWEVSVCLWTHSGQTTMQQPLHSLASLYCTIFLECSSPVHILHRYWAEEPLREYVWTFLVTIRLACPDFLK